MSYISVLMPGEEIVRIGKLHWIIYVRAMMLLAVTAVFWWLGITYPYDELLSFPYVTVAVCLGALSLMSFLRAWLNKWTTEIAVTNRRIIYKRGFISRHIAEMNMKQVESVNVDQSVLGRILGYGSIHILGTGEGLEHLHRIADPIALRLAIMAR